MPDTREGWWWQILSTRCRSRPSEVEQSRQWHTPTRYGRPDATTRTLPHTQPPLKRSVLPRSSRFATEVERLHAGLEPLRR